MLLQLLVFVSLALAFQPEPKEHALNGWSKGQRALSKTRLDVVLAVARPFSLTETLYDISNPKHALYGQHWNMQQVQESTTPAQDTMKAIQTFSKKHNLSCELIEGHSDWMICPQVRVRVLEKLFKAEFHYYSHQKAPGASLPRTASYELPIELIGHVDFVGGIKRLPDMRQAQRRVKKMRQNGGGVTPQRSRELWNVPEDVKGDPSNGNIGEVAQFLGQYMSRSDLEQFWTSLSLPATKNVTIFGPNKASQPGDEASLDIQTFTGVNQGSETWFVVTAGLHDTQEPFLKWLLSIAGRTVTAYVHSVSYGDVESSLDLAFLLRVDQEFQKLSLTGNTFVYSSGDSGVSCADGIQSPDFPASSPHVLSIGGSVDNGSASPDSWNGSGGGASNVFADPEFMRATHEAYLSNPNNNVPPSNTYNNTGRWFPDVNGIAMDVVLVVNGQEGLVGGTSCASPAVSAILTLLNDLRLAAGKPVLGYVNPLIYAQDSSAFVTISTGPSNSANGCQGFKPDSEGGWSPIVGFGGLSYSAWKNIV